MNGDWLDILEGLIRIVWVRDLGGQILLVEGYGIALADAALSRAAVVAAVLVSLAEPLPS